MTRSFPTEVLLSITTGCLLSEFGAMHECCEFLAGQPIWTHQFAYRPFLDELKAAVLAQHPELKTVDASGVTPDNFREFSATQIQRFGAALDLIPMSALITRAHDAMTEPLRGKKVIRLNIGEE